MNLEYVIEKLETSNDLLVGSKCREMCDGSWKQASKREKIIGSKNCSSRILSSRH